MTGRSWPAELAVAALRREGVTSMFGLMGGHINAIQDYAYRAGIDVFQVRHEQAAVHAADGFARLGRRPGVCFATAGPGMTNTVTGLHMSYLARTPVVCLLGAHKLMEEGRATAQEADARAVLGSVTKSVRRCTFPEQADLYLRLAFREAMTYPYGPVAIEFPLDIFNRGPIAAADQLGFAGGDTHLGPPPGSLGDPSAVERACDLLLAAERPLVLAGDGVHWDGAGAELLALVETLELPVSLRRHARGAVPERHPLVVPAAIRKRAIQEADVVLVLGLALDYYENFGDWRTDARFIQVSRHPSEIAVNLRTAEEICGDQRSVLHQLNERLSSVPRDARTGAKRHAEAWRERAAAWRADRDAQIDARIDTRIDTGADTGADAEAGARPRGRRLHPGVMARELAAELPGDVPVILDSFTASAFLAQHLEPQNSGYVLDAGLSAAFGHGVGMAIGASVALGNRPVVSVLGDGGIGLGGGDIETAVRYGIPAVFVVYNNSALCGGLERYAYGPGYALLGPTARGGFNVTEDVAYERMYAPLGCHTELVTGPGQLGAAVRRSLDGDGPSVVNVLGDRDVRPPLYDTAHAKEMFWHLPVDEVAEPARTRHHEALYPRYHGGDTWTGDLAPREMS